MFYAGGEKHDNFIKLFDANALKEKMNAANFQKLVIFGEAYGGKQQGQAYRYGKDLKFVAFDVKLGEHWLNVPEAEKIVKDLGLEFVHYVKVPTELAALDAQRDAPSEQARRNGVATPQEVPTGFLYISVSAYPEAQPQTRISWLNDQPREGVVLRPLEETSDKWGERIICKHKRDEERETKTARKVVEGIEAKQELLKAEAAAEEWVVLTRLEHVLQKIPNAQMENMREIIAAMLEDVFREGAGEVADTKDTRNAISRKTAILFKQYLKDHIQ